MSKERRDREKALEEFNEDLSKLFHHYCTKRGIPLHELLGFFEIVKHHIIGEICSDDEEDHEEPPYRFKNN